MSRFSVLKSLQIFGDSAEDTLNDSFSYLKAVSVQHDEPGGVDTLQLDADFSREGEVVHVNYQPQVVVSRPDRSRESHVSPRLDRLVVSSVPGPVRSAAVKPRRSSWTSGNRFSRSHQPFTTLSAALFEAHAEHHGDRRDYDEREDGQGESQHQTLVDRNVSLCGARSDHHRLGPLVWKTSSISHGPWTAVIQPHVHVQVLLQRLRNVMEVQKQDAVEEGSHLDFRWAPWERVGLMVFVWFAFPALIKLSFLPVETVNRELWPQRWRTSFRSDMMQ